MIANQKEHWDRIYTTKSPQEVSWTESTPTTSLNFIHSFGLSHDSPIIDIGGGESRLVDYLLDEGFTKITVLDISEIALEKARQRLGERAKEVKWIVSDITEFEPQERYKMWHDRATFHFLTTREQIQKYLRAVTSALSGSAYMTIGTFSENGPTKCSGLNIQQYSEQTLEGLLRMNFRKIQCIQEDHVTPFRTTQNFLFCSFAKKSIKAF